MDCIVGGAVFKSAAYDRERALFGRIEVKVKAMGLANLGREERGSRRRLLGWGILRFHQVKSIISMPRPTIGICPDYVDVVLRKYARQVARAAAAHTPV